MRLEHAELPAALVEAHHEGQLVVFVGAGVSNPSPSSIPLFSDLVSQVAEELAVGDSWNKSKTPEDVLEDLDGRELGVHAAIHQIISGSTAPNDAHRAVAELCCAGPTIRIVTTNYDRHLSASLPADVRVYESPDLPGDEDFTGVVHLHGSIAQEPDRLVATKSDFAGAYMQPLSSTLAFLHRLFTSKTVLFVGYSADDLLMQYVLRAARGRTDLYTFQERPVDSKWEDLAIEPVTYASHDLLPAVLGEWARRVSASPAQHGEWVSRIVSSCASLEELSDRDDSYLWEVVSNPDLVRVFTRHARGPVWFRWVAERVDSALFDPAKKTLGVADKALLDWFLDNFHADDETANEVVRLLVSNGRRVHPDLAANLEMRLSFQGDISSASAAKLRLVLAASAQRSVGGSIRPYGAHQLHWADDLGDEEFLELIDRHCAPAIAEPESLLAMLDSSVLLRAASHDPFPRERSLDTVRKAWTNRRHLAEDLLSIVDGHIRRVCRIESIAGNPDPYVFRAAIEPHEQNSNVRDTDFLVDAARDLYEVLAEDRPQLAAGYLESWAVSRWPILKRLSIHGLRARTDVSADEKIGRLLGEGWATDSALHHEVFGLIADTAGAASQDRIEALIEEAEQCVEEDSTWLRFNRLGWIAKHAPDSPAAQGAFEAAQNAHPEFEMAEHPDVRGWIEITSSSVEVESVIAPEDLANQLIEDAPAAIGNLIAHAEHSDPSAARPFDRFGVHEAVTDAIELSVAAGISLLEALANPCDAESIPDRSLADSAITALLKPQSQAEIAEQHAARMRLLLPDLWRAVERWEADPQAPSDHGWFFAALNRCPGKVVQLAVQLALSSPQVHAEPGEGLEAIDQQFLELVIEGDSPALHLAQVMCARYAWWLHAADRRWAKTRLLPMFEPTADDQRAVRCWEAYLSNRRWNDEMLDDGLLDSSRVFAGHADQCTEDAQNAYAHMAADLCVTNYADRKADMTEWLTGVIGNASDATRTRFHRAIAQRLSNEDPESVASQWHRWMRDYWQQRLKGIPRPLVPAESGALAGWAVLLADDAPEAVNLVCSIDTPLMPDSTLFTEVREVGEGTGRYIDFVERFPQQSARFMAHLLKCTAHESTQYMEFVARSFIQALEDRVDATTFQPVRDEIMRLGWDKRRD